MSTVESDGAERWSCATLFVRSEVLTATDLADQLGPADRVTERGTPVSSRNPNGPTHRASVWAIDSPLPAECRVQDQVEWLTRAVEERAEILHSLAPEAEAVVQLSYTNPGTGGPYWTPEAIQLLGSVPVALIVTGHSD